MSVRIRAITLVGAILAVSVIAIVLFVHLAR